jgi:hypothetical protein
MGWLALAVDVGHPRFGDTLRCPVCGEHRQVEYLRESCRLSPEMQTWTFETTPKRAVNAQAWDTAKTLSAAPAWFLTLQGGYGVGKTRLLACLVNAGRAAKYTSIYLTTSELLDHLRARPPDRLRDQRRPRRPAWLPGEPLAGSARQSLPHCGRRHAPGTARLTWTVFSAMPLPGTALSCTTPTMRCVAARSVGWRAPSNACCGIVVSGALDMDDYPVQEELWMGPGTAKDAKKWYQLTRALGFPADAAYGDVVEEIRRWRAWADVVRIGVMTAIPDRELPEVSDPE